MPPFVLIAGPLSVTSHWRDIISVERFALDSTEDQRASWRYELSQGVRWGRNIQSVLIISGRAILGRVPGSLREQSYDRALTQYAMNIVMVP